jgi:TRAP-type mannitol/chloroaromatic compound transport system permease large subunit
MARIHQFLFNYILLLSILLRLFIYVYGTFTVDLLYNGVLLCISLNPSSVIHWRPLIGHTEISRYYKSRVDLFDFYF